MCLKNRVRRMERSPEDLLMQNGKIATRRHQMSPPNDGQAIQCGIHIKRAEMLLIAFRYVRAQDQPMQQLLRDPS